MESDHERRINTLLTDIKRGKYSDLEADTPMSPHVRRLSCYNGVHANESLIEGFTSTSHPTLDIWVTSSGDRFRKSPATLGLDDLHFFGAGLPGQLAEADGSPRRRKPTCGKRLKHGWIKATADGESILGAPEQFIHCDSFRCPACLRYNVYVSSEDMAARISAARDNEARRGAAAAIYHVVLSPPQLKNDPMAAFRWLSQEGFNDLRRQAYIYLRQLGALGGAVVVHHFREDGQDGIEHAADTGNSGNPDYWRLGLHFHVLAIFDYRQMYDFGPRAAELSRVTGWTFKILGDNAGQKKDGQKTKIRDRQVKTFDGLKNLAFYVRSHASIMISDHGGRALESVTYFDGANHGRLREIYGPSGRPLIIEGYNQTDDDGRPYYWVDELARLAPLGLVHLAEVERANRGRVYVDKADYDACSREVADLRRRLGLSPAEDLPPADIWRLISSDSRYLYHFEPMNPDDMRPPRRDLLDGRDLWIFYGDSPQDPEYLAYCAEADAREAQLAEDKARSLGHVAEDLDDLDDFKAKLSALHGLGGDSYV